MLTNLDIAELLASAGDSADEYRRRAYQRAAGAALTWPDEVGDLLEDGIPLSSLPQIGDRLAARIEGWFEDPPEVPEPPPARAGFVTLAWARARLREDPAWRSRARGDLQMHTAYSDGKNSVIEMAAAAAELEHSYIAITDHSGGQAVPRGMDTGAMKRQHEEIDALNKTMSGDGFRVVKGIEMNLDPAGAGDVEHGVLDDFELVLGSFHSKLRVTDDQTSRYLGAVRNPSVDVLAHPTARRYNRRKGLDADWAAVFKAAVEAGTALEIDSHPHRGDLPIGLARLAAQEGVTFSIGSDAHAPAELRFIDVSLAIALEAGVDPERILIFQGVEQVLAWSDR